MKRSLILAASAALVATSASFGSIAYFQDFEINPSASWASFSGPSDSAADFFFDYSTVGIPKAPSGFGTRGMKLQANLSNGIFSGMSASPVGLNLSGNYIVQFDLWANYNGPLGPGGSGSTNLSTFGVGTAGTSAQWPGGVQDSVWFAATGDGNSASDYRAYSTAAPTSYAAGNAVYAATSLNNTNAYYSTLGGNPAPAAQVALFPQQTGTTAVGSMGMEWHRMTISNIDNVITWKIGDLLIATVPVGGTVTLAGGNIFFGHSDINATSSTDPNDAALLFTLVDNIVVVPEPAAMSLLIPAGLLLTRRRK
jgi:hypothetical protein